VLKSLSSFNRDKISQEILAKCEVKLNLASQHKIDIYISAMRHMFLILR
jgi:hypothetical protein